MCLSTLSLPQPYSGSLLFPPFPRTGCLLMRKRQGSSHPNMCAYIQHGWHLALDPTSLLLVDEYILRITQDAPSAHTAIPFPSIPLTTVACFLPNPKQQQFSSSRFPRHATPATLPQPRRYSVGAALRSSHNATLLANLNGCAPNITDKLPNRPASGGVNNCASLVDSRTMG